MVVMVTAVAIAFVVVMGLTVTEGFDWLVGFLATGRAFFGEGRVFGGQGERCVEIIINYGE